MNIASIFSKIENFDIFRQKKIIKKWTFSLGADIYLIGSVFDADSEYRIEKNHQIDITWLMADFRIFSTRHSFSIDYNTLRKHFSFQIFCVLIPTLLRLSRKIMKNFLTDAQNCQNPIFPKFFFDFFRKIHFFAMKGSTSDLYHYWFWKTFI